MQRSTWKKEERFFQTRKEFSSFRPSTSFIRDTVLPYSIKSYYHKLSSLLNIKKMFFDLEKAFKETKKDRKHLSTLRRGGCGVNILEDGRNRIALLQ
jgi:hypothetical protein